MIASPRGSFSRRRRRTSARAGPPRSYAALGLWSPGPTEMLPYGHLAQQRCVLMVTWPNRDASLRSSDQTEVRRHETLVWVT